MSLAAVPRPTQAEFAAALLDPARPCPPGLRAWNGSDPAVRFAVHRNNVMVAMIEALADAYPVLQALVGEAFFAALARAFVRAHPPCSPVMALYGEGFAEFVAEFGPAAVLAYLPDVARLEWHRVRAFQAADAVPLARAEMARRLDEPLLLPGSMLALQPALAVLCSRHAVVSLWAAHQDGGDIASVDPGLPESALVLRQPGPEGEVLVIGVEPGCARFVAALAGGACFADALAAAGEALDLAAVLGLLIGHGAIVGWHPPSTLRTDP